MRNLPQTIADVNRVTKSLERAGVIRLVQKYQPGDHVQVRVRGVVLCGRVRGGLWDAWESTTDPRIHVRTPLGVIKARPFDLRQCSRVADGRCACAPAERSEPGAHAPGFVLPPLGNTGVAA